MGRRLQELVFRVRSFHFEPAGQMRVTWLLENHFNGFGVTDVNAQAAVLLDSQWSTRFQSCDC